MPLSFIKRLSFTGTIFNNGENLVKALVHILGRMLWMNLAGLVLLFAARLVFYLNYGGTLTEGAEFADVFKTFFTGFRFDLQVLCYFNVLFLVIFTLISVFKTGHFDSLFKRLLTHFYVIAFCAVLLLSVIDYFYYAYFLNRIDDLIFAIVEDDTRALVITMWDNYPIVLIFTLAAAGYYGVYKLSLLCNTEKLYDLYKQWAGSRRPVFQAITLFTVAAVVFFLFARGTLGTFPLSVWNSPKVTNEFLNKTALNAPVAFFQVVKDRKKRKDKEYNYAADYNYPEPRKALEDYYQKPVPFRNSITGSVMATTSKKRRKQPHVVLVVMESFGSYWLKFHSPEFNIMGELERQMPRAVSFPNFVSATGSTLGSITFLVTGLPPIVKKGFLSEGKYKRSGISCASAIPYGSQGYETSFVYAGDAYWRNMKEYYEKQGLDKVYTVHEIEQHFTDTGDSGPSIKNAWGAYDEYIFGFVLDMLKNATKPQMVIVLTTTNHPPYDIPKNYNPYPVQIPGELKERLIGSDDLNEQRFRVFQYSNNSLGLFLKAVQEEGLQDNTVIAVTGDHGFRSINFSPDRPLDQYGVPFYLFMPRDLAPKNYNSQAVGYHGDIWPTLYNLTLSSAQYCNLGNNLLDSKASPMGIYMTNVFSSYGMLDPSGGYLHWADGKPGAVQTTDKKTKGLQQTEKRYRALMVLGEAIVEEDYARSKSKSK